MSKRITIIGAGPGGYTAAFEAAKRGAEVTLIESTWLGGTCLNCGCIPTKTLKASAEALETVKHASSFGVLGVGNFKIDMPSVIARKRKTTEILRSGLEKTCAQLKINLIYGSARIVNSSLVEIAHPEDNTKIIERIESDTIIIATGSTHLNLPGLIIDNKHIITSADALELETVPTSIIIVGGGVIGCELAFIYNSFGSKVTIVEGLDRALPVPSVDEEMSKILQREMKKAGIILKTHSIVSETSIANGKVSAKLAPSPFLDTIPESVKKEEILEADIVIIAAGRVPSTDGLGLLELGIETDKRGFIMANEYLETNIPHVYAIGDILGPSKIMLAHMASMEAIVAVKNCFGAKEKINYDVVPSAIFVSPEIGTVGLTEAQAKAKGYDVEVSLFQFRELGKAQAMGELPGAFKIIADRKTKKLLGAHIAGAHATDLIAEMTLALQLGTSVEEIAHTIHAHPTLAEGIFEATHRFTE